MRTAPTQLLRQLPDSEPSERGLLGSILLGAIAFDPFVLIEGHVEATDFFDEGYGALFAGLKLLHEGGKPIGDLKVLLAELPRVHVPENVRGGLFLAKLAGECPNAAHLVYYADIIRAASQKRRIISACSRALEAAYMEQSVPATLIANLEAELAGILANARTGVLGLDEAMQQVAATALEELDRPIRSACAWGLPSIDAAVGLLMRGELIILGADPGSGKTAFVTQIAVHAAASGKRTFFASLEMQAGEIGERELCRAVDVDSRKLRGGSLSREMVEKMCMTANNFGKSPIRIWSPASATLSQIRGMAKHEHAKEPLSLVIVDYLQLVQAEPGEHKENRATRVGNVASGLRQLAKELSVPVIALSQLNRTDRKAGEAPTMKSLRESGDIEANANVAVFLHPAEQRKPGQPVNTQFIVGKCRAGELGGTMLVFHPKETRFTEPAGPVQAAPEKRNSTLDSYQQQAFQ